jgi:hypothetical protein
VATLTVNENLLSGTATPTFLSMFSNPLQTLASMRQHPRCIAATAVTATYVTALSYYVIQRVGLQNILESTIRATASVDPDALIAHAMAQKSQILLMQGISGFVGTWISVFGMALLYWLLVLVVGADATYERIAAISAHVTLFTTVVKQSMIALAATMTATPAAFNVKQPLATNLGFFIKPHSRALMQLAVSTDIIALSGLFLTMYGIRKVSDRLSSAEAAGVVLVPWLLYVGIRIGMPMLA